MVYSAATFE